MDKSAVNLESEIDMINARLCDIRYENGEVMKAFAEVVSRESRLLDLEERVDAIYMRMVDALNIESRLSLKLDEMKRVTDKFDKVQDDAQKAITEEVGKVLEQRAAFKIVP